jgi:hypothetical protein
MQANIIEDVEEPIMALEGLSKCQNKPFRLLVSTADHGVHVFDVLSPNSCSPQETLPACEPVVAITHNYHHIVLGLWDGRIQLLDQVCAHVFHALPPHWYITPQTW